jgi:uncharacterized SAM-binding protein YcdF (DUF218 family)
LPQAPHRIAKLLYLALALALIPSVRAQLPQSPPPGVPAEVWSNYLAIPSTNTTLTHFDVIIVLGMPCTLDGKSPPEQRERVLEGIREYRAHIAPRLIMTGGAAHNNFVEAHCMAQLAIAEGVPAADILEEAQAHDTIQNIYFSHQIMQAHHWTSAEVVSSPSHLPRTALILQHYPDLQWRTRAAPWPPEYNADKINQLYTGESKGCWTLTHTGFKPNQWLPGSEPKE